MSSFQLHTCILAAGGATRFGSAKQLALFRGQTLLNSCINTYVTAGLQPVHVLLGAELERISQSLLQGKIISVPHWQRGMAQTICCAVDSVPSSASHLLLGLGDQPLISTSELTKLIELSQAFQQHVIAAEFDDAFGPPVIFPRSVFPQLKRLSGDIGARKLIHASSKVKFVSIPSAAFDIDTSEDLTSALSS